jgi:hypothetical protein
VRRLAAAYGWPALVAFVLAATIASAVSLIATVWQLTGSVERRKPQRRARYVRVP